MGRFSSSSFASASSGMISTFGTARSTLAYVFGRDGTQTDDSGIGGIIFFGAYLHLAWAVMVAGVNAAVLALLGWVNYIP
jgi:hypothetical protein